MKAFFDAFIGNIKQHFGFTNVTLTGGQTTALTAVGDNLVSIGNILNEGKVSSELATPALMALYNAKIAVNAAIVGGWQGGKGQY